MRLVARRAKCHRRALSNKSMRDWAAPLCDTIQQAHRGQFDADALRDVYAADAVFEP